jgi:hypothetical protein
MSAVDMTDDPELIRMNEDSNLPGKSVNRIRDLRLESTGRPLNADWGQNTANPSA